MMSEKDKRLIEENMDKLEVTIKSLAKKFNVPACDFDDYRQTAYLTLCGKAHKFDGRTQFITFANTVITNAMIDKYRREKNRNVEMVSLNDTCFECEDETNLLYFLASENDTENEVLTRVTNDMVKKYIRNAKDKCTAKTTVRGFEALELKLEGYSGEEIACMFNVPSNSLRSWMSKAKKFLLCEEDFVELVRG